MKKWYLSYNSAVAVCTEDKNVTAMKGYNRLEDFYILVPKKGLITRSANSSRYGDYMQELFIDGSFVGACRMNKINNVKKLYDAGYAQEASSYALGYMLWSETSLGGKKINQRKEAARISHDIIYEGGKAAHAARQEIRKKYCLNEKSGQKKCPLAFRLIYNSRNCRKDYYFF